ERDVAGDRPAVVAQEGLVGLVGDAGEALEEMHGGGFRCGWVGRPFPEGRTLGKGSPKAALANLCTAPKLCSPPCHVRRSWAPLPAMAPVVKGEVDVCCPS